MSLRGVGDSWSLLRCLVASDSVVISVVMMVRLNKMAEAW